MTHAALVTGGTRGIGAATVQRLRSDGWQVAFTGRDSARGAAVAEATGARFLQADATDRAASDAAVDEAHAAFGRLDLLVANAGILVAGPLVATSDAAFATLLETNLTSAFRAARSVIPHLRAQGGGSIVVVASDAAIRGSHRIPAYSVVKAGAVMLAEMIAADGAPDGIRCNALCPGNTLPGMAGDDAATWRPTTSGRFATGEDVAAAVAWLASDAARHVSGATIRIDGATGAALIVA